MKRSAAKQVMQLIGQTYLVTLVGLLIGIFSARSLTIADRGLLATLLLIAQLCSRVGALGFEQVLHKSGRLFAPADFYRAGFLGGLLTLPVAAAALWLAGSDLWLSLLIVLIAGFISILRVNVALLIHFEDIRQLTILNLSQAILQLLMYALAFNTHSVSVFFALWAVNVILFSLVSSFLIGKKVQSSRTDLEALTLPQVWRRGLAYTAVNVPEIALSFCLELPVIRSVLGPQASGLYAISNTLTGIYYQVFTALSSILIRMKSGFPRLPVYAGLLALCLGMIFLAPPVISFLFGERYEEATGFLYVMMPVTFALGVVRLEQVVSQQQTASITQFSSSVVLIAMVLLGAFIGKHYLIPWIATSYLLFSAWNYLALRFQSSKE